MALTEKQSSPDRLLFEPMGIFVPVDAQSTLKEAAERAGVVLRSDCGGLGTCGKCRVSAQPKESLSPPTEKEIELLGPDRLAAGQRLACQTHAVDRATVTVPLEGVENGEARGKTGLAGVFPVSRMIDRIVLPETPGGSERLSGHRDLVSWIGARAEAQTGRRVNLAGPELLRQISRPSALEGGLTLVNHRRRGVTAVIEGRRTSSLGLAVDVGTTTIAGYLCDLTSGRVLTSAGAANPQRRYGEDVISRIAFADGQESGLETLRRLAAEAIDGLIGECLARAGFGREDVDEVTIVGNTTMEQIVAGIHPHGLGVFPYLPASADMTDLTAAEMGLDLNPGTNIHLFPVVSGFIGGDTVGAILAVEPHRRDEISLIVDIGTNGEVVLGNRDRLWATSCATGPALEGAHLSCGMRAAAGAVHRVEADETTGRLAYEVLDGRPGTRPAGLCGSGVVDLLAALRRTGLLLETGRFNDGRPEIRRDDKGIGREFVIAGAGDSATGREVVFSLADVRQVQLAKAALSVGITFLMREAGIDRVDRLYLTGAFGARFNWRSAVAIGMLPPAAVAGAVETLENAAGVGAVLALLDRSRRAEALEMTGMVTVVDLAADPAFNLEFPLATSFPPLEGAQGREEANDGRSDRS